MDGTQFSQGDVFNSKAGVVLGDGDRCDQSECQSRVAAGGSALRALRIGADGPRRLSRALLSREHSAAAEAALDAADGDRRRTTRID